MRSQAVPARAAEELEVPVAALFEKNRRSARNPSTGETQHYHVPSSRRYPFQWFWDSCFHAIVLSHFSPALAREELDLMVSGQLADGRIPHVLFRERTHYHRPHTYWAWLQAANRGMPAHSGLIQPPVLALAVEKVAGAERDPAFLERMVTAILRFHAYLRTVRDPDGDGLLSIISPFESGMDYKPSYDPPLGAHWRPLSSLILRTRLLDLHNRRHGYRADHLLRIGRFNVEDLLVNSVFAEAQWAAARLLRGLGMDEEARTEEEGALRTERAVLDLCRGDDGFFYDIYGRLEKLSRVRTICGLLPLTFSSSPPEVDGHLLSLLEDEQWFGTPYAAPSVSVNDPAFSPSLLTLWGSPLIWRGTTWLNVNWLLVRGLRRKGYDAQAARLVASSLEAVRRSGFREHFNPYTGEGYGARDFGWSTLVYDMLVDGH